MFISFILIHSFCVILSLCDTDLCVKEIAPGRNKYDLFTKGNTDFITKHTFNELVNPELLDYCTMDSTMNGTKYNVNKNCIVVFVDEHKDFQGNETRVKPNNNRDCYMFFSKLKYPKIKVSENRTKIRSFRRTVYTPSGIRWYFVAVSVEGNKDHISAANAYLYVKN